MELVPSNPAEGKYMMSNGTVISYDDTRFWEVLFGGDQLTVARIRGTQALRDTEETARDRLEGIIPVVEDWHTRMTFMKVQCHDIYTVAYCYIIQVAIRLTCIEIVVNTLL